MNDNTVPSLRSIRGSVSHESRISPLLSLMNQLDNGVKPKPETKKAAVHTCKTFQESLLALDGLCGLVPKHELEDSGLVISNGETWALPGTSAHNELSKSGANIIISYAQLTHAGAPAHQKALEFLNVAAFIWVPLLIAPLLMLTLGIIAATQSGYVFAIGCLAGALWAITWTVQAFRHTGGIHDILDLYDILLKAISFGPSLSEVTTPSLRRLAGLGVMRHAKIQNAAVCLLGFAAIELQILFPSSFWAIAPVCGLLVTVHLICSKYLNAANGSHDVVEFEIGLDTLANSIGEGYWEQVVSVVDSETLDQIDSFIGLCEDLDIHPLDLSLDEIDGANEEAPESKEA